MRAPLLFIARISACLLLAVPVLRADGLGGPYTEAFWRLQIRKIHLGMRQGLVEEFLPQRSEWKQDYAKDGESYVATYALDEHWSVAIGYDRSGWHEKNNPYTVMGFPNDRVIVLPRLIKQENKIDGKTWPQLRARMTIHEDWEPVRL